MRRYVLPVLLLSASVLPAQGPGTLTLEQARSTALAHHPVSTDKQLYLQAGEARARVQGEHHYPQVNVAAGGTYQSEVTEFDLGPDAPFPPFIISPDQYKAGLEVSQTLYSFGTTHVQRELELTKAKTQMAQADVELMGISERVDRIYGNILLQRENLRILRSRAAEIDARQAKVASAVRNGVSLKSNEEVLHAESLTTRQRTVEAQTALVELTQALGTLMGQPVDTTMTFTLPAAPAATSGTRPELQLYALQSASSELQSALVKKKNLPRLTAFGDGYYGRPGFNFLNNEFRTYGIVGVNLSWNITGLALQGRDLDVNSIERQLIDSRRKSFELQQRIDLDRGAQEVAKLDALLALDEEIVKSKTFVREAASSQLENGVITAQDYVTYQNAQDQAKFDLELHHIQAVMARIDLQRTQGY